MGIKCSSTRDPIQSASSKRTISQVSPLSLRHFLRWVLDLLHLSLPLQTTTPCSSHGAVPHQAVAKNIVVEKAGQNSWGRIDRNFHRGKGPRQTKRQSKFTTSIEKYFS